MTAPQQGQPDEYAAGERWSVARFGPLIVAVTDGRSDDVQHATAADASREFADLVAHWSSNAAHND